MWGRMPLNKVIRKRCVLAFGIVLLLSTGSVRAREAQLCHDAAQRAAAQHGILFAVLWGIAQTETSRDREGVVEPWPWTLNINAQGYWLNSRHSARKRAEASIATGQVSVDLGCFQINHHWYGQHFSSTDEMLDPDAGAAYFARFLKSLFAERGNWSEAAGANHSRTPEHAARYRQRFDHFFAVAMAKTDQLTSQVTQQNSFLLLRAGAGQTRLGSLVPFPESDG